MVINKKSLEQNNNEWSRLYKISAWAALLMAVFIPIQILIFVVWPPPVTVAGWFSLFQHNNFIGLMDMDLVLICDQVLMILIFLALYVVLKRFNVSLITIALAFGMIGTATYFASGSAFEMLSLSNQYSSAFDQTHKTALLAAGQVMLANYQGTAFNVAYVLQGTALLIISIIMLRSRIFGKITSYVAVLLGIMSLIPPTAGLIGMIFALGSLVPLEIFDILIARKFFQLSRN